MQYKLSLALAVLASTSIADETRQLDSHEHGVGQLNIAFDGNKVAMELHAPGADIVGFEYEAKSAEDRAAIDAAVATLARPLELFVVPAAAECNVTQASATLESEEEHDEHEKHDHDNEEDHAKADEHDHGHDEDHAHADEHDDHGHEEDHADADEHDDHGHDDEHSAEASHTEFHAEYELTCANPGAFSEISFAYFETFESARELEVQVVTASGAQAFEIERDEPKLDLRGMI